VSSRFLTYAISLLDLTRKHCLSSPMGVKFVSPRLAVESRFREENLAMKNPLFKLSSCFGFVLVVMLAAGAQTQNRERFGISTKAGGVNFVFGRVALKRGGHTFDQPLTTQDDLAAGDIVRSGVGSCIEVLLSPGSYLRVGENSEFELVDNSTDNLSLKLVKGSAIIEATGADDTELKINIATDHGAVVIVRRGIYRLNAQPDMTELLVKKGRVLIASSSGEAVNDRNKITFTRGVATTAKLGLDREDNFDLWSRERAKMLVQANANLSAGVLRGYLASSNWERPLNLLSGSSFWVWSPAQRCYTLGLFGHRTWLTPYGGGYWDIGFYYGVFDLSGCCDHGSRQRASGPGSSSGSPGVSSASAGTGISGGSTGSGTPGSSAGSSSFRIGAPSPQPGPRQPDGEPRSINRPRVP